MKKIIKGIMGEKSNKISIVNLVNIIGSKAYLLIEK
jgi:hypothetical protein